MDKSRPKSTPRPGEPDLDAFETAAEKPTGRVKFDDRGNAIWEWSITTGAFGPDTSTQRLRRLENGTLTVADDAPTPFNPVKPNPMGTVKGYNPYDSGKLAPSTERPRKKDLKKLSEWVALRKQAGKNKEQD